MKEGATSAVLRLLSETHGGPIDSGTVSRYAGVTVKSACTAIIRMQKDGRVHVYRATAGKMLYAFSSEAACTAYGTAELEADALARVRERNRRCAAAQNRAIPMRDGVDAPVTIKKQTRKDWDATPVDYSKAKKTIGTHYTHDIRYGLPPETKVVGGFATQGIGRYES